MNTLKMSSARNAAANPEVPDHLVDRAAQHSRAPSQIASDAGERAARSIPGSQALVKPQSIRVAIKVKEKILFIHLGDVVSVQAKGNYVWFQRHDSSYLLRESISVLAARLETHGFIRIHRSVLVNTSFVKEIRRLSTGECCLRVEGGKEFTVTRTYKKNLKSLAEFWIGTGAFFPG
jgi:DNA-binding LytR/AlgR family response regulator